MTTDGKVRKKSVMVTVTNDSPIKIDHPTPGSGVRDQFELAAYVDNKQLPDVALFSVESVTSSLISGVPSEEQEEDPNFAVLKKTFPGNAYVQPVDVSFVEHELDFTVHFKAVASDGKFATRTTAFRVDNDPNISIGMRNSSGDFNAVLSPGVAFIDWEVTNRGPNDEVILNGKNQQDVKMNWLGSGSIPLVLQGTNEDNNVPTQYKISASRVAPNNKIYSSEKEISITQIKIKGLETGLIEPYTQAIQLSGATSTTRWKALFESKDKTTELTGIGDKIFIDSLEPRTSYEMVVQILNASGKGVITESLPIKFTTTDFRLVSWTPFYWGSLKYNAYPSLQSMVTYGGTEWVDQPIVGPHFMGDGLNYANTNQYKAIHGSSQELTIELLLSVNDTSKTVDYLVSKTGEYVLGFDPINGYKVNLQLNKLCEDAPGDYIASGIPMTEGLHHLVVTYNAVAKQVIFYIDGQKKIVPVEGLKLQNLCYTAVTLNSRLDLDNKNTVVDDFDGVLGDLAIYNRALSESEVLASCKRLGVCF